MWRVFRSAIWCWRNSKILLRNISLLKPYNATAGPKDLSWWGRSSHSRKFSTWAFKVLETFLDWKGKGRSAWIVLVHFWCMHFINTSCYFPGVRFRVVQPRTQPQENYVSFAYISSPDSASKLKNYRTIEVKALREKDIGEELYIAYGF